MKSFTKRRVVKSYDVEVATPRMVERPEGLQLWESCLTVLSIGEEDKSATNLEHPGLIDIAVEAEAQEKAALILAEAQEKAALILAEAELSAQEMFAQTQTDLVRLRQEVTEAARGEGLQAGQAEGYQVGKQDGETEGKRLLQEANRLFELAQRAMQEEYAKVDEDLLQLSLKIAERIVRSCLAVEPQRLMEIIRALALLPQERLGWRLHVSSEDARWLEGNLPPCPYVIDDSLSPGDCFLECQEGVFDARLEAQLNKLEHTLREELEHGGLESINSDGGTD